MSEEMHFGKHATEVPLPQTDSEMFKNYIRRLNEAGISPSPLILLEKDGKNPHTKKPIKQSDGSLNPAVMISPDDAVWKVGMGWNIGIYGLPKGLIFLDLDMEDGNLVIPPDICDELIETADTFTVMTRSGGFHLHFLNDGPIENSILYFKGKKSGECRCNWQYVVSPGSYVPKGIGKKGYTEDATGLYTTIRDRPIRKFDPKILPMGLTLGNKDNPLKKKAQVDKEAHNTETDDTVIKNQDGKSLAFFRVLDKKLNKKLNGASEEDRSSADYGVVCRLAYYGFTETDAAKILQIYRPYVKTDRHDYLTRTISKAFANTPDRWTPPQRNDTDILPYIDGRGLAMRDITRMSLAALYRTNNPPFLFIRTGSICRVLYDELNRPKIDVINEKSLRGILDRSVNFGKWVERKGGEMEFSPERPPMDIVIDILALGTWEFPALKNITCVPVILEDGTLVVSRGYEPRTKLYYAPSPDLEIPQIPEFPSHDDVQTAVNLLREVFCDFPFDSDASYANLIGLLITSVLRPVISGETPLTVIDKPQAGTGASLIASVIALIATGQIAAMMPPPVDDEEMRKKITARVLAGDSLMIIDNVEGILSSPSLAALLTTGIWNDRILGQTKTINMTVCATWIVTGNNIRLGLDMPRRCYHIRMDAKRAHPWDRTGFKHPNLLKWVKNERGRILAAVYTLARAWIQADKPKPRDVPNLGSFEAWRNCIGGILEVAGIGGFLGNLEKMYEESDVDTPQWSVFLETLFQICGASPFTAAEIEGVLESERNHTLSDTGGSRCLMDSLPNHIADAWLSRKNFTRVLGNEFGKQKDRLFPNGLKIIKFGNHAGAVRWLVQQQGESQKNPSIVDHGESGESSINRTICT